MNLDLASLDAQTAYALLTGAILPRPIAWVSTFDASGVSNLAPYSFFTVASVWPPVLAVAQVNPRDGSDKDTLRNLRKTGACIVNVVSHAQAASMNATAAPLPAGVSEFERCGIAAVTGLAVDAPGVAEAPVRYECRLREIVAVGEGPMAGQLMLLDVVHISIADEVLHEGRIDPALLDAVGKLGGEAYSSTRDRFTMARPTT
ncbi:MAG: flavin reductase family protein [Pseudomonadota bacterium]